MAITEPRPTSGYSCSRAELYAGIGILWDSFALDEGVFILKNTNYTAGLAVTKKASIVTIMNMPDGQVSGEVSETARVELVKLHDRSIEAWNTLDTYIKKAFLGENYKPKVEAAGKFHYPKAVKKDWEEVSLLLAAGKAFMIKPENAPLLTAPGGMPATFPGEYDTVMGLFGGQYSIFKSAQQSSQEQVDAKINAENALYKDGRSMMMDGQLYFRKEASKRDRYVWERIMELVSTPSGGGTLKEGTLTSGQFLNLFGVGDLSATSKFRVKVSGGQSYWIYSADSAGQGYSGWGYNVNDPNNNLILDWNQIGGQKSFVNVYNQNGFEVEYQVELV